MDESAYSTLLKYVENTEYSENVYYVSAKGETRPVVRETEKHRILRACHSDSTAGQYIFYVF